MSDPDTVWRRPSKRNEAAKVIVRVKGSGSAGELHQGTVKLRGCANCGSSNNATKLR